MKKPPNIFDFHDSLIKSARENTETRARAAGTNFSEPERRALAIEADPDALNDFENMYAFFDPDYLDHLESAKSKVAAAAESEKVEPEIELYDFQKEAVEACLKKLRKNEPGGILVMPTGAGKTFTAEAIMSSCEQEGLCDCVFMLSHTKKLNSQNAEAAKLKQIKTSKELSALLLNKESPKGRYQVSGQVFALFMKKNKEYENIPNSLGVFDEAHHYASRTWTKIVSLFDKTFALTATPFRTDKKSILDVFDGVTYRVDYATLWRRKRLAPMNLDYVQTGATVHTKYKPRSDDFDDFQISDVDYKIRNEKIVERIIADQKTGARARSLVFMESVGSAQEISNSLNDAGINSASISYKTPKKEREKIFSAFESGEIAVLTNNLVLTEGFDVRSIEFVYFARPTKSANIALQAIGRGLRIDPENPDKICQVVCFVDKVADIDNPDVILKTIDIAEALGASAKAEGRIDEDLLNLEDLLEEGKIRTGMVRNSEPKVFSKKTAWFKLGANSWVCFAGMGTKKRYREGRRWIEYIGDKRYIKAQLIVLPDMRIRAILKKWQNVGSYDIGWTRDYSINNEEIFPPMPVPEAAKIILKRVSLAGKSNYTISDAQTEILQSKAGYSSVNNMSEDEKLFRLEVHFKNLDDDRAAAGIWVECPDETRFFVKINGEILDENMRFASIDVKRREAVYNYILMNRMISKSKTIKKIAKIILGTD